MVFFVFISQYLQAQFVPVVIWLLQHRILYQVHIYITLLPPSEYERTSEVSEDCSSSELSSSIEVLSVTGDTGSFNGQFDVINCQFNSDWA